MKLELTEAQIQGSCIEWFRYQYPELILFSIPNEATYKRSTYFSSLGALKGVADTEILFNGGKAVFVEFKTPKGKQKPEQIAFEEKATKLGFHYFICRSLEEFQNIIKKEIV